MKGTVFLGPSLPPEDAKETLAGLDVDIRPPVRRGDLPSLSKDVDIVAIVDGVFLGDSSVGHREIISFLRRGATVIGGGSMGALRAFELKGHGMRGLGIVFGMYESGEVDGDDEVALVFDPETLAPLSEPLVNTRYLLHAAVARNVISEDEAHRIINWIKAEFYPRRNRDLLRKAANACLDESRGRTIVDMASDVRFDAKRSDALLVLNTLRGLLGSDLQKWSKLNIYPQMK